MKIKEKYRNLNRWIRAAIILALLALFCGGSVFVAAFKNDPNFAMMHFHGKLKLNETKALTYSSDKKGIGRRRSGFPVLYFEPEKNGEYTFTLSDIKSEEGVYLKLMVMDEELSDYINEDNSSAGDDGNGQQTDTLSGTALLNADTGYYVVVEAGETTVHESYEGSFNITVTEAEEDKGLPEITAGATVRIPVNADSRSGVMFRPEEEGFYRFATMIADDPSGFSSVSAVTTEEGENIDVKVKDKTVAIGRLHVASRDTKGVKK